MTLQAASVRETRILQVAVENDLAARALIFALHFVGDRVDSLRLAPLRVLLVREE